LPGALTRLALTAAAALVLSACEPQLEAPVTRGACFHMVPDPAAEHGQRFNRLPGTYVSLEYCAAALEAVRARGGRGEINGAYQTQFLFHNRRGIYVAQRYDGARYLALVRTRDNRLAMPGAAPRR
jgi:hypothetical protein